MKKYLTILAAALIVAFPACKENDNKTQTTPSGGTQTQLDPAIDVSVGQVLPAWQEGYLDIHSINGGRGEAFYYIFPDGTAMLCDAAGAPPAEKHSYGNDAQGTPSKPNVNVNSGDVIVNYIKHFAPDVSSGKLDYFMTSHYHGDHIGSWRDNYASFGWAAYDKEGNKVSSVNLNNGGFLGIGLAEVGLNIPISKVFDRGNWSSRPSSDYYTDAGKKRYAMYVNYLDYAARKQGTVRETLVPGRDDQIVLLHSPEKYPTFSLRAISVGGDIWTGKGTEINTTYVPSAAECDKNHEAWAISENIFSNSFHLTYGLFDFFAGGDIQYSGRSAYPWKDIENPISQAMKKVEGMKASHHSTANTNSAELLGVLKPDFYIAGVWREVQPNPATLKRVLTANPSTRIFTTNLMDSNAATLKSEGVDPATFLSTGGHVVVRVLPEGKKYYIFVLDDTNENYKVKYKYGPFSAYY